MIKKEKEIRRKIRKQMHNLSNPNSKRLPERVGAGYRWYFRVGKIHNLLLVRYTHFYRPGHIVRGALFLNELFHALCINFISHGARISLAGR
jgi:hypothetical protein